MPAPCRSCFSNVERAAVGGAVIRDRYRSEFAKPCSGRQGARTSFRRSSSDALIRRWASAMLRCRTLAESASLNALHGTPRRV